MKEEVKINLPQEVEYILQQLELHGYEGFAVGGCVRDSIIGRNPQDYDVATSATPEQVKSIFSKTIDTGLKHGTVTVLIDKIPFEITTYRVEGKYINNRKPETVAFTGSLELDLSRRDFTINAMAYHPSKGLVDPFGGIQDIRARIVKTVGNANDRFEEDALRMLRAIRFSAQLGYDIETATLEAISMHHKLINNISGERIRDELNKILLANPMAFETMRKTKLLSQIMPELDICFDTEQNNPYHSYNVGKHSLVAASSCPKDSLLRWTMLLHDIGKPDSISTDSKGIDHFYHHQQISASKAVEIMKRLRFDNVTMEKIKKLIIEHDRQVAVHDKSVRKAVSALGAELFPDWLQVKQADAMAQHTSKLEERMADLTAIKAIYERIVAEHQCLTLKELAIKGSDLLELGLSPGKQLGEILQHLLEAVIENPEWNQKDILLEMAKKMI